jgi:hypothetical protein
MEQDKRWETACDGEAERTEPTHSGDYPFEEEKQANQPTGSTSTGGDYPMPGGSGGHSRSEPTGACGKADQGEVSGA